MTIGIVSARLPIQDTDEGSVGTKQKKKWLEPNEGGRYPFNILTEEIIGD